jgi:hypothetical protein
MSFPMGVSADDIDFAIEWTQDLSTWAETGDIAQQALTQQKSASPS